MVTIEAAQAFAMAMPGVTEGTRHGHRTWFVNGRAFAWERPFSKADLKRFGAATPPDGPIIAISVADLNEKEAVLAANKSAIFTIEHFNNYPAVLVALNKASVKVLREALLDGWLTSAPAQIAEEYLKGRR